MEELYDEEWEYFEDYKKIQGATEEELLAFEKDLGVVLPEEFKALYRYKNGSGYPFIVLFPIFNEEMCIPQFLLSLDEIRERKTYFCNKNMLMEGNVDDGELAELDERIRPFLQHTNWLPFAEMPNGSINFMIDFNPTESGEMGQIIIYVHDPDFVYYVSGTLDELLEMTIEVLEQEGLYEEIQGWI